MNTKTSNLSKRAGRAVVAQLFAYILFVLLPSTVLAQSYSGPLVITKGGTYKGNWESKDSEVAAVEIRTSEPVIIENSNIRGAGYLIKSWGYSVNLTVRHTNGYGIQQTPWRDYKKPRRFVTVNNFQNLVVENCYMESTAGIYAGTRYEGDNSSSEGIRIRYNVAKNIDGRVYGGDKEHSQFVQFNFKGAIRHAEVAWNQVINEADKSLVEDNINIYNTRGFAGSPIRIHNNYIQGAYPAPANGTKYSGGGIITDGDAGINDCPAYIEAYENQLIGLGNYSMGIAGGNNIRYHHNRAVNAATFDNGSKYSMYTSGLWSKDYYHQNTTFANSVDNNVVGIVAWGYNNNRNDVSVAENADFKNNTFLPNPITKQSEKDEFSMWQSKLSKNGIVLGPNGSASATPANQAPTVAITSPTANSNVAFGTSIVINANANDTDGSVTKVEFYQGAVKLGEDTSAPFSYTWNNVAVGTYSLTAKAYDNAGASKTSSAVSVNVEKQVVEEAPVASTEQAPSSNTAAGTGKITHDFWANIHGAGVSVVPVNQTPTSSSELTLFEAPSGKGNNYGQRIRGYVTAPVSGQYTFWVAGDDQAELYLSTTEDPAGKKKIAYTNSWTGAREWTKHSTQQSAKITLEAGKRYYIEALSKQEGGGDNLAVAWQLPNGTKEAPIAGNRLSEMGSKAPVVATSITAPVGKITLEKWNSVHGSTVSVIPVTTKPHHTQDLTSFEAPSNTGDNYGQRIRGYITAPESGQYTFWIAGDDKAELYLSTTEDPAKKQRIAYVSDWTGAREWTKRSGQQSAKITLEAGKRYYIEALHLEGGGGDNVAVAWQLPSGAKEAPIAGNRLSPLGESLENISALQVSEVSDSDAFFAQTTAYPNPFRDVVTLNFGDKEVELAEVVVLDQTGRVVYKESKLELVNNQLTFNLADLKTGLYFLKYTDKAGKSDSIKIVKE
ncbi:PA14 domain-containing protein [Pontibacter korlensis]|uniref:PA14 domain-containing protein n=1 Tax=Pontibacter korlensis TaxID=400092 RepID=UPI0008FFA72D|nr:PA14 domain-containing protein [Pontibacter korlensis]